MRTFQERKVPKPPRLKPFILAPESGCQAIDLEIGCGVGWHPIRYAQENPQRFLIAIEHTQEKFEKFYSRFNRNQRPDNLLPVHANAISWITHCLQPSSVSRCFILYPNPNPKNKSLRWIRMPFMAKLLEVLKPSGEIIMATNKRDYFEEALEHAGDWKLSRESTRELSAGFAPRTHFEKKYLARGETCFEVVLRKLESSSTGEMTQGPFL